MIGRMLDFLSRDMAMDLGTANTLIYVRGKGVVLDEPSMVALDRETKKVVAIGKEAKELAGRHGRNTISCRPLRDGVISDFDSASYMIRSFLGKVFRRVPLSRPKLVVAVPAGITSVEKRAVMEASEMSGAGKVFLIEEPMAAAIGTALPIDKPMGQMIVDIGGGTTEVAVISKFAVACSESLRVAGDEANEAICQYIRREHHIFVSEMMAEIIKIKIGSAVPLKKNLELKLRGKDLTTGMPKVVTITDADVRHGHQRTDPGDHRSGAASAGEDVAGPGFRCGGKWHLAGRRRGSAEGLEAPGPSSHRSRCPQIGRSSPFRHPRRRCGYREFRLLSHGFRQLIIRIDLFQSPFRSPFRPQKIFRRRFPVYKGLVFAFVGPRFDASKYVSSITHSHHGFRYPQECDKVELKCGEDHADAFEGLRFQEFGGCGRLLWPVHVRGRGERRWQIQPLRCHSLFERSDRSPSD